MRSLSPPWCIFLSGRRNWPPKAISGPIIKTPKIHIKPRGANQQRYVEAIRNHHDINFWCWSGGNRQNHSYCRLRRSGFAEDQVKRILLVRPAVEAGEKLGFLPGDLGPESRPYLRPLYDALYEMLGFEQVARLLEKGLIEIAPLAFMRGRTLNHSSLSWMRVEHLTRADEDVSYPHWFWTTAVITGDNPGRPAAGPQWSQTP